MLKMNIADMGIEVIQDRDIRSRYNLHIFKRFNSFITIDSAKVDLQVYLKSCDQIIRSSEENFLKEGNIWETKDSGKEITSICIYKGVSTNFTTMLNFDTDWKKASITYLEEASEAVCADIVSLAEVLFRIFMLFHQGIEIHASAIEWEGKGIVFSAPSGTGKSTQAKLWKRHMGAKILNGDRPVIRAAENKAYVFGTPWSGSSSDFLNSSAPLSAIIMLEQAANNSIQRLEKQDILLQFMPRCFLPFHYLSFMELALTIIEKILSTTPVYLLRCRPDKEAMELVHQCIK